MLWPPSLDPDIRSRAFHAANGELAVLPEHVMSFLAACRYDRVDVLGWELWVVDHVWGERFSGPVPAPGSWCGGIPVRGHDIPVVFGFNGDADESERQLATLDLAVEVLPEWLSHIRVNFTLAD